MGKNILLFVISTINWISLAYFQVQKSDIKIYYFDKSNLVKGINIDLSNPDQLKEVGFSPQRDTVFHLHGFNELPTTFFSSGSEIKKAILSKYDANVFIVDYSYWSSGLYPTVVQQVDGIGHILSNFITEAVEKIGLNLNKTKLSGISLGAHIAGVIGSALNGQIEQLVGLDPAGPLFNLPERPSKINKSSAKFVHVTHTCAGRFGLDQSVGHADYWINGGKTQPACIPTPLGLCPHIISLFYYVESILTGNFKAKKCNSYANFTKGMCNDAEESRMGEYNVDKSASGNYFLNTNSKPPYARG